MARRYPLAPLLGLRRERVEARAAEHRTLARQSETRSNEARAARGRREGVERELGRERGQERRRLELGALKIQDLQQSERHRVGAVERVRSLKAREAEASERARVAEQARAAARMKLERARAEQRVSEEHARRFRRGVDAAEERAEEEANLDRWATSRRGARRG